MLAPEIMQMPSTNLINGPPHRWRLYLTLSLYYILLLPLSHLPHDFIIV